MEWTNDKIKRLVREEKLEFDSGLAFSDSIVYIYNSYELWTGTGGEIHIYKLRSLGMLFKMESTILMDYHNSPKQKMKRLLDATN